MQSTSRLTIGQALDRAAQAHPDLEAVVDLPSGSRMTYAQLASASDILARGFMALGLEVGARLALWAPSLPEWPLVQMAAAKAGLVLSNLDVAAKAPQLKHQLADSGAELLLTVPGLEGGEFIELLSGLGISADGKGRASAPDFPQLARVGLIGTERGWGLARIAALAEGVAPKELAQRQELFGPMDTAALFYTSGTTGMPKGVMVHHHGLVSTSLAGGRNQGLGPGDRLCVSVPMSHMFGAICLGLTGLVLGATLVIPSRLPEPEAILDAIESERLTAVYGPPTMFTAFKESLKERPRDIGSLRTGIMAGAVCPLPLMKMVVEEMGIKGILIGYGQTEASSWISQTKPDDPLELRVSTVGKALPGVEVRIAEPADGRAMEAGRMGELWARGYVMQGYLNRPRKTKEALDAEGWLHTGDLATVDESGYIRIMGRLKEAIRGRDGLILPSEVEAALLDHSLVADAQVFALPLAQGGDEVAAWVRLESDELISPAELRAFLGGRLAEAKIPRYIKLVDSFPMTPLGKPMKGRMSQAYGAELAERGE